MSTFLSSKNGTKARKPHRCVLCGERINVGDVQDRRTGISDGRVWTMHMHPECHAHEQRPGVVDPDWYEDVCDPAFSRDEAVEAQEKAEAELKAEQDNSAINEIELRVSRAIVSKIWVQLGSPTYEQLKGRSIYDLIDELKAELAKERARLDWLDNHLNYELRITVFGEEIGIASDGGPCELRSAIDAAMKEGA